MYSLIDNKTPASIICEINFKLYSTVKYVPTVNRTKKGIFQILKGVKAFVNSS